MATNGRNWCFTVNANEEEAKLWVDTATAELAPVDLFDAEHMKAAFYQLERAPTTGQVHLQGFVVMHKVSRLTAVSKVLPHAHLELMKGTVVQNVEYCSKSATKVAGPWKFGELPVKQGKRTDWDSVKKDLEAGKTKKEVLLEHPHLAPCAKGIDALVDALMPEPPLSRNIEVWYLTGPTGTGKTHRAYTAFPKAYKVKGKYFEGKTFDQYAGQETLILDEWDPYEWPLTLMNTLLDKWECPLQCRFFNKYAYWTRVIICTNYKLEECYPAVMELQRNTFQRRIHHEIEIVDQQNPVVDFNQDIDLAVAQAMVDLDTPVDPGSVASTSKDVGPSKKKQKTVPTDMTAGVDPVYVPPVQPVVDPRGTSRSVTFSRMRPIVQK